MLVFSPKTLLCRSKSISTIVCHHIVFLCYLKKRFTLNVCMFCIVFWSCLRILAVNLISEFFLFWGVGGGDLSVCVCVGDGGGKLK